MVVKAMILPRRTITLSLQSVTAEGTENVENTKNIKNIENTENVEVFEC
jgi:hypothetical protein